MLDFIAVGSLTVHFRSKIRTILTVNCPCLASCVVLKGSRKITNPIWFERHLISEENNAPFALWTPVRFFAIGR